jgi:hypothetical protein
MSGLVNVSVLAGRMGSGTSLTRRPRQLKGSSSPHCCSSRRAKATGSSRRSAAERPSSSLHAVIDLRWTAIRTPAVWHWRPRAVFDSRSMQLEIAAAALHRGWKLGWSTQVDKKVAQAVECHGEDVPDNFAGQEIRQDHA